jgi:DNA-binding transcriptional LysR family regulator
VSELRVLRHVLAIAAAGSVNAAASALGVAQPALSRQLAAFEREVGFRLFDRSPGGIRPTAAGMRFLPMARELTARADAMETAARAIADGVPDCLEVVAPATTVSDVIAPFLAAGGPAGPMVTAREELPAAVFTALARGEADLAISSGPPPTGFATRLLFRFPVWAYVAESHRWARRHVARVAVRELADEPLIVLGTEHGTRRLLDQAMDDEGLAYHRAFETNVPQIAQALAASARGVAVVSDDPRYGLRPLLVESRTGPLRISLHAAWDPEHYAAASIERWVAALAAYSAVRYRDLPAAQAGEEDAATAMTSISTTIAS